MTPFIAQSVYAIADHSTGAYKKGDEYFVYDRHPSMCRCGIELIAIGHRKKASGYQDCNRCGVRFKTPGPYVFFASSQFASAIEVDMAVAELLYENH
jgi:hypothetical protein